VLELLELELELELELLPPLPEGLAVVLAGLEPPPEEPAADELPPELLDVFRFGACGPATGPVTGLLAALTASAVPFSPLPPPPPTAPPAKKPNAPATRTATPPMINARISSTST
jgi:hypothetical protein